MRADGATWNAIREATGTKFSSSWWFKAWEREGIEHIAAGERVKAKPEPAAIAAKPSEPAKPKRTAKRSKTASKS